jgi:hypothetical protein
VAGLPENP